MALPPPPKFTFWNSHPPTWDAIRKRGLWEVMKSQGGALVNGFPAFTNDSQRAPWPLPTQQGDVCLWTRKLVLTRHGISQHLHLGLPRSLNCENEMSVVYNPPALRPFIIAAQTDWDSHRPRITNLREPCWEECLAPNTCLSCVSCFHYGRYWRCPRSRTAWLSLTSCCIQWGQFIFYILIPSYFFLWKVWILEDFRRWDFKSKLLFFGILMLQQIYPFAET